MCPGYRRYVYIVRVLPHCITVRVLATAGMNMVQLLRYCITARILATVGMITVCVLAIAGMYI